MNKQPSYNELLSINQELNEKIHNLESIIHEQEAFIDQLIDASTLYRELWISLKFNTQK